MIFFVTGHQRAGTHSYAEKLVSENGITYFEERNIGLNNFELAMVLVHLHNGDSVEASKMLDKALDGEALELFEQEWDSIEKACKKGFVLQCPFLAHKTLELSKHGKVYWCSRDTLMTVTSMANGCFDVFSWGIMKAFKKEFPDAPIWPTLEYNGSKDVYSRFVKYHKLLVEVKEYFYDNYFKHVAEKIQLEDRKDFNPKKTYAVKMPLKTAEMVGLGL